ncbi:glycoside hydrolase family 61 protein [Pseudomassariella vexata]|uniref:lytic cellulose monooxygenase (C4-dehydrogenating) n=1 Tax=Pseudomassariella vexata TaxID=1141098 RepID=A0A1Y2EKW6_9PEZI|nr:glycoside hydrolase family 61 protein [Pseudomassariella vexata]ORY71495.1 glycoside hydrolase family 61 protein [Pseudomassariella vexata]
MRSTTFALLGALATRKAAAHATFQDLWINGVDYGAQCVRLPASNSPVTDVTSNDIRCNAGSSPVAAKCIVAAGDTVTIEIHQQPGDRSCDTEAIGGAHYGPVQAYLSAVDDSAAADGSTGWFKIYADTWAKNSAGASGDDDFWGTKDINTCCGRLDVKIPTDIASGDYLLRAEALALHTASSTAGAQFYMSCYQLTISGTGTATPATVSLPGAYNASDPGILVDIHAPMSTYIAPGPTVYTGGSTKSAGAACVGCESTCTAGSGPTGTASSAPLPTATGACSVALYAQCGGIGYTGCTACTSGKCSVLSDYYSQCTN